MQNRTLRALCFVAVCSFGVAVLAQEKAAVSTRPAAYDIERESTVVGTVVSYNPASKTVPMGAHVVLQTSSGTLDVHLGDPRLLIANHFSIKTGDTVRVVGENMAFGSKGTQFVARIVQNGTQAIQVRSIRGFPLSYAAPRDNSKQGGAL